MAKKSMVARENKRARTVAKYAAKRAKLKETIADVNATDDALGSPDGAPEVAAKCEPRAPTASLPDYWSAAWCLPQVRVVPKQVT